MIGAKKIGKVYAIPPQPPVAENNHVLPAGAITFGVEYRNVDPENLFATYAGNADHLAEFEAQYPDGGFTDEGVSLHVCGTDDGHEYVRFDVFDDGPHYHYIHRPSPDGEVVNNVIDYDATALGEMLPWAVDCLRTRLPEMLTEAGGAHLVPQLDPAVLLPVIDRVQEMATEAQRAHRAGPARP